MKIVREHPALFLGELREDLERVYVGDKDGKKLDVLLKVKGTDETFGETLVVYPNDLEFEIVK